MRVVIFFVCLCYMLLGGYNYLYTGNHHRTCSPALHFEKNHSKFTEKQQAYSVVEQAPSGEAGAYLIPDLEEDDSDNLSARKYKLLASYFYALAYSFILAHFYSRVKASRPYHNLFSFKYITQRVLRI